MDSNGIIVIGVDAQVVWLEKKIVLVVFLFWGGRMNGSGKEQAAKYTIIIRDVGSYSENSLIKLMWTVFTHRLFHLIRGEGFRD
jgi:hypothetical protein